MQTLTHDASQTYFWLQDYPGVLSGLFWGVWGNTQDPGQPFLAN